MQPSITKIGSDNSLLQSRKSVRPEMPSYCSPSSEAGSITTCSTHSFVRKYCVPHWFTCCREIQYWPGSFYEYLSVVQARTLFGFVVPVAKSAYQVHWELITILFGLMDMPACRCYTTEKSQRTPLGCYGVWVYQYGYDCGDNDIPAEHDHDGGSTIPNKGTQPDLSDVELTCICNSSLVFWCPRIIVGFLLVCCLL